MAVRDGLTIHMPRFRVLSPRASGISSVSADSGDATESLLEVSTDPDSVSLVPVSQLVRVSATTTAAVKIVARLLMPV